MNDDIKNLKLKIDILKKRVNYLETIERRRKISKIIKIVVIVIIIIIIGIFAYKWYKEIMDFYNKVKNFMNNPLKSFM